MSDRYLGVIYKETGFSKGFSEVTKGWFVQEFSLSLPEGRTMERHDSLRDALEWAVDAARYDFETTCSVLLLHPDGGLDTVIYDPQRKDWELRAKYPTSRDSTYIVLYDKLSLEEVSEKYQHFNQSPEFNGRLYCYCRTPF